MEKLSEDSINERLDNIEKILKMLVVNSITDELANDTVDMNSMCETIVLSKELNVLLEQNNVNIIDTVCKEGCSFLYIEIGDLKTYGVKDIILLDKMIKNVTKNIVPVFRFETLNGMRRKKLIEEGISFCINKKEIYISAKLN